MKANLIIIVLIMLCLLVWSGPLYVYACSNKYYTGKWVNTPNNLRVHSYPEIEIFYNSYSQGLWSWNYISKDVMILSHHSGSHTCSPSNCHIRLKGYYMENPNYLGLTHHYYKTWAGFFRDETWGRSKDWHYSEIIINLSPDIPYIHSFADATPFHRQQLIVHELGHSIGLNHSHEWCNSIMLGAFSRLYYKPYNTPQNHDRFTLLGKYGNPH